MAAGRRAAWRNQETATTLVTVVSTGQTFRCPRGELILDAGLEAGIGLPHNCRGGACGTCKSQILEGEVDHGWVMSFAISDEEKAAGKCLICQSRPLTPTLVIRPDNAMAPAEDAPPVPMDARATVLAADAVSASVRRLVIALPPAIRFRFRAGMHVELKTPGVAKPRTYSIACAPDDQGLAPDGLLEFFITRHERGQASGWLHKAELGAAIDLHGPRGNFRLPQDAAGPLLCLAGGSGLAPILSIVRRALASGHRRSDRADPVGARSQRGVRAGCAARARPAPCQFHLSHHLDPSARGRAGLAPRPHSRVAGRGAARTWPTGTFWPPGRPALSMPALPRRARLGAAHARILTDSFTPTIG